MEHAEYLIGQLLLQDVLNVDLKAEDTVGPALDADVTVLMHTGYGEKRAIEGNPQSFPEFTTLQRHQAYSSAQSSEICLPTPQKEEASQYVSVPALICGLDIGF